MKYVRLLALLALFSCEHKQPDFGAASSFYPPEEILREGVVNKYYEHFQYSDGQASLIRVRYHHYQLHDDGKLAETIYGAGFDPIVYKEYAFDSSRQVLLHEETYNDFDTVSSEIISDGYFHWSQQSNVFKVLRSFPFGDYAIEVIQLDWADQVIDGRNTRTFDRQVLTDFRNGESSNSFHTEMIFAEGIGLYAEHSKHATFTLDKELVEQMPFVEFNKRSRHGLKRVGWLNPERFIDKDREFSPCGALDSVRDYYNAEPDGRYTKGKNGLVRDVRSRLDSSRLGNASGYLTYRFMVNCRGEAGWHVVDGVDMNYQPMSFDQTTVDHLYDILVSLDRWEPIVLRGARQDAYFYVTFKFEHGEITHILP